jgi:hypothetical protein
MLSNSIDGVLHESFSLPVTVLGTTVNIDLIEGGSEKEVDDQNKAEYVELVVQYMSKGLINNQLNALIEGLREVVDLQALQSSDIEASDLNTILIGRTEVDVDEIEGSAQYAGGYTSASPQIMWFWCALRNMERVDVQAVVHFITGMHQIPLDGFDPPFTITLAVHESGTRALPRCHTCFNLLALPPYTSYDELISRLKFAIANASTEFYLS